MPEGQTVWAMKAIDTKAALALSFNSRADFSSRRGLVGTAILYIPS